MMLLKLKIQHFSPTKENNRICIKYKKVLGNNAPRFLLQVKNANLYEKNAWFVADFNFYFGNPYFDCRDCYMLYFYASETMNT